MQGKRKKSKDDDNNIFMTCCQPGPLFIVYMVALLRDINSKTVLTDTERLGPISQGHYR